MKKRRIRQEDIIPDYVAYTDGSCNNFSPFGEGGASYVLLNGADREIIKTSSKSLIDTTNNRAELLAILSAICAVPADSSILIRTDSKYCITVLDVKTQILPKANKDIVKQCFAAINLRQHVFFEWVKGHNGDMMNELADGLAEDRREEVRNKFRIPVYTYKEYNRPFTPQEKLRIQRFNKWIGKEDSRIYLDVLPF